jgi:hypothetical protein
MMMKMGVSGAGIVSHQQQQPQMQMQKKYVIQPGTKASQMNDQYEGSMLEKKGGMRD